MQAQPVQEQTVWEGSPSQWLNFKTFLLSSVALVILVALAVILWPAATSAARGYEWAVPVGMAVLLVLAAFPALRAYLDTRCTRYMMTTERARIGRGILSRRTDDMELYRVDDILLVEPLMLRLVSRANLELVTSDRTTPTQVLKAIPEAARLRDQIRKHIEACRDRKKTRVLDFQ